MDVQSRYAAHQAGAILDPHFPLDHLDLEPGEDATFRQLVEAFEFWPGQSEITHEAFLEREGFEPWLHDLWARVSNPDEVRRWKRRQADRDRRRLRQAKEREALEERQRFERESLERDGLI